MPTTSKNPLGFTQAMPQRSTGDSQGNHVSSLCLGASAVLACHASAAPFGAQGFLEVWGEGATLDELVADVKAHMPSPDSDCFSADRSWKVQPLFDSRYHV